MTAYLILAALTILALVVYIAAEKASDIRAWVERDPFDLDDELGRKYRCGRPGCRVNHGGRR